ncbi:unnamed protein product [Rhizoctonia solani]|uniref:Zn(2)-C6 fungal-type domain-containing protein n=1 Tax=Rhizoctonia solani TaxID=456999 RepID=A0A8H3D8G4_9AGAM|nr:unnamed protein product [Rhizoctonia solani]
MSARSITGCSNCKKKRKKCDETKPMCLRCTRSGMSCAYEYVESTGRHKKPRTKPAPRSAGEQARKDGKRAISTNLRLSDNSESPAAEIANFLTNTPGYFPGPSLDFTSHRGSDSEAVIQDIPFLEPIEGFLSGSIASRRSMRAVRPITISNQPALSAQHGINRQAQTDLPRKHRHSRIFSLGIEEPYYLPARTLDQVLNLVADYRAEEHSPGVKETCSLVSIWLDPTVDSNFFPFVLQCYAQWITVALFDPHQLLRPTKDAIINQVSRFPTSRPRIFLIAQLMRSLTKSRILDTGGRRVYKQLEAAVWRNLHNFIPGGEPQGEDRERACMALDNTMEFISLQMNCAPLSVMLNLLQTAAPIFLAACPPPHPPVMSDILLDLTINLKHFIAADIATSITTGRPLLCRYHVPWSLDFCNQFMNKLGNRGSQGILGIPDQLILLFVYMNNLKEDANATGTTVDPGLIEQIEKDARSVEIPLYESEDPLLLVGRMVVQECWREAMIIYLHMALGGVHVLDSRVQRAQHGLVRLVNTIKPERKIDTFLAIPMTVAGFAATKPRHRMTLASRILQVPGYTQPDTAMNEILLMVKDVWARTDAEGRPANWEDLGEARRRVTGVYAAKARTYFMQADCSVDSEHCYRL